MTIDVEDRLRRTLREVADRLEESGQEQARSVPVDGSRRRPRRVMAAAAAVMIAVGLAAVTAAVVAERGDESGSVVAGPGSVAPSVAPPGDEPEPVDDGLRPVVPAIAVAVDVDGLTYRAVVEQTSDGRMCVSPEFPPSSSPQPPAEPVCLPADAGGDDLVVGRVELPWTHADVIYAIGGADVESIRAVHYQEPPPELPEATRVDGDVAVHVAVHAIHVDELEALDGAGTPVASTLIPNRAPDTDSLAIPLPSGPLPPDGTPLCGPDDLEIVSASGMFVRIFASRVCWLAGYPAVSLRDESGNWVAFRGTGRKHLVTNGPTWTGLFEDGWTAVTTIEFGPPTGEEPRPFDALRLTLPNDAGDIELDGLDLTVEADTVTVTPFEADSQDF